GLNSRNKKSFLNTTTLILGQFAFSVQVLSFGKRSTIHLIQFLYEAAPYPPLSVAVPLGGDYRGS
ncbi:MAG TPA: hypothetical protein V6C57_16660, partial [Coleofasciculaceae cyanobacterium]